MKYFKRLVFHHGAFQTELVWNVLMLTLFIIICGEFAPSAAEPPMELKLDALPKIDPSQFVGAEKCATCHKSYFDGWKTTLHSKMVQPAVAEGPGKTILGDFT